VFSINRYGRAYHDFYVAYDPATRQDRFYGSGYAGYYVFDVSRLDAPKMLTSVTGVAGVDHAHAFQATPDGRYAIGESEDQYQPLRVFDLKPGLDGTVKNISRPIGAWMPDWRDLPHNVEMRWPYVFVSSYEDDLRMPPRAELQCHERRLGRAGTQRRRADRSERPDNRVLGVQDGWIRRLERPPVGYAEHLECAGLG
jgi:hypothetical protein